MPCITCCDIIYVKIQKPTTCSQTSNTSMSTRGLLCDYCKKMRRISFNYNCSCNESNRKWKKSLQATLIILILLGHCHHVTAAVSNYPEVYMYDASNICRSLLPGLGSSSPTTSPAGQVSLTSQSSYPRGASCSLTLDLRGTGARFAFHIPPDQIDLARGDRLEIIDRNTDRNQRRRLLSITGDEGKENGPVSYMDYTTSSALTIAFYSSRPYREHTTHPHRGFTLIWTQFHMGECDTEGEEAKEHQCSTNGWCISKTLVCDGVVNCWGGSDEGPEQCSYLGIEGRSEFSSHHITLGSALSIVLAISLVAVIVVGVATVLIKRRRRRAVTRGGARDAAHHQYEPCVRPAYPHGQHQPPFNPHYDKPTRL